jgi:hypothetical protein
MRNGLVEEVWIERKVLAGIDEWGCRTIRLAGGSGCWTWSAHGIGTGLSTRIGDGTD